jgi:hypothetical protein
MSKTVSQQNPQFLFYVYKIKAYMYIHTYVTEKTT